LDDILEHLLKIGIPKDEMLRLGGKSTALTEPLALQNQPRKGTRSRDQWAIIDSQKHCLEDIYEDLQMAYDTFTSRKFVPFHEIADYLKHHDPRIFTALQVPNIKDPSGMIKVDEKGKPLKRSYLMDHWKRGLDAGVFKDDFTDPEVREVWQMPHTMRRTLWSNWEESIRKADVENFCSLARTYNQAKDRLEKAQNTGMLPLLRSKRVLGCTTTAAAKYCEEIQTFNPDVVLVEEAGEILESHILTAMGPETSQLVLIGDHKFVALSHI